jgi:MoxR-like ATPase
LLILVNPASSQKSHTLFRVTKEYPDTVILPADTLVSKARLWCLPYPRNPLFTDREAVIEKLHTALTSGRVAVLSGLGGIGKTQTAIEVTVQVVM